MPASPHNTQHLSDAMSRLARRLQAEHGDVEGTLQAITAAAVTTVPHADDCGVSYVIGRRKIEPRAWTSDLPRMVDSLQERLRQGPCMDAVWEQQSSESTTSEPTSADPSSPGRPPDWVWAA